MSRKDDVDNRANQLNPNNDAYLSSRGIGVGGGDDDDDAPDLAWKREIRASRERAGLEKSVWLQSKLKSAELELSRRRENLDRLLQAESAPRLHVAVAERGVAEASRDVAHAQEAVRR